MKINGKLVYTSVSCSCVHTLTEAPPLSVHLPAMWTSWGPINMLISTGIQACGESTLWVSFLCCLWNLLQLHHLGAICFSLLGSGEGALSREQCWQKTCFLKKHWKNVTEKLNASSQGSYLNLYLANYNYTICYACSHKYLYRLIWCIIIDHTDNCVYTFIYIYSYIDNYMTDATLLHIPVCA